MDLTSVCRSILAGLDAPLIITDLSGTVVHMNPAAEELTGEKIEERAGKHISEITGAVPEDGCEGDITRPQSPRAVRLKGKDLIISSSPLLDGSAVLGSMIRLQPGSSDPPPAAKRLSGKEQNEPDDRQSDQRRELAKRDRILAGVVLATNQLLTSNEQDQAINQALEILGSAADVDRVYIFQNRDGEDGHPDHELRYEWCRDGFVSRGGEISREFPAPDLFPQWQETLRHGSHIKGPSRSFSREERSFLEGLGVSSILVVPIFVNGLFWGFIGFDDCRSERAWSWSEASILFAMAGTFGGAMARWQAEQELRQSEEEYRELVEHSNSIIMRRNISGEITFFNHFAQKFFGYSEQEILGKDVVGTIVPEFDSAGRDLRKMIEDIGRNPDRYETNVNENMRSNGERVWVAWTNRPIRNLSGEVIELLCVGNDITARKRAEERLEMAHEKLSGIIEFLPDATFVVDSDRKVIAWNKAIEEMTGVSKGEVLGRGDYIYSTPFYGKPRPMLIDLIGSDISAISEDYFDVKQTDARLCAGVHVPKLLEGKGAYVWAVASAILDRNGQAIGAIESIRDVTKYVKAEEEAKRRDLLLAGAAAAANSLLISCGCDKKIDQALEILCLSANLDRVFVFENRCSSNGEISALQKYAWCREDMPNPGEDIVPRLPNDGCISRWCGNLSLRKTISGPATDFPEAERAAIEGRGVKSLAVVPVFIEGRFWGFTVFEDCHSHRTWERSEMSILEVAAGSIGSALERRQRDEELRGTRDFLENLIDHANAPIIVWDPGFRITRFNRAFERLTGLSADEALGKHLQMLFPVESKTESLDHIQRTRSGERWEAVEIPILRKDGRVRTVLWNSATIYEGDGKTVLATIAQGQDITERKIAEEQVQFQASLLDQVHNAVIATDRKGVITYWNKHAEALHQWTAEEAVGRNISETTVPEGRKEKMQQTMSRIISNSHLECELQVRRKDGSTFPAYYVFNTLENSERRRTGFLGVSIDITERKAAEENLRLAKERAEAATKAKSQFLASMSHEIRTPMNAVIGLTGLLLNTDLSPEQRDFVETIRSSGDALMTIITDILDFSKIEGDKMELETQPLDLVDCIEESIDLIAQSAVEKGLNLSYSVDSQVPPIIVGDLTRLRQVLVNLLSNAVKFTDQGEVSISVASQPSGEGQEIQFAIKDTGIGIAPERMDRLFHHFSQVDMSINRKYGGTGLGLAISKRLVEMMGGSIWAESELGSGSTFNFKITAKVAPILAEELKGIRVLVATSNQAQSKYLIDQLISFSAQPVVCSPMQTDERKIMQHKPDLLIIDLDAEDGEKLLQKMDPAVLPPLVALGSHKGDERIFSGALTHPIRPSRLADVLTEALRRPAGRVPPALPPVPGECKSVRILLAEDNLVNQKVALRMLERLGYRADVAANGFEAISALQLRPYDVVLMDVQMPEMDGLKATRRIRYLETIHQPYIIAMTAYATKGDREKCLSAGMNDYIAKPVRMEELEAALQLKRDISPAVDRKALEELRKLQTEDDPDIVQELIEMYLGRAPARIAALKEALMGDKPQELCKEAHDLKSSSAILGAVRLSAICEKLEAMGRSGSLDTASELIERAEAELELAKDALESEIEQK
ncbi:MAG: PAS domain S-box protein [Methanotrichaceae archaeon]|nr:PAS domain S-box protein [Methanotrichaceae archaeon]